MEEEAESLSINRTRYTVSLALQVTINMVLDGKHSTAVVAERIPVASLLLEGEVPTYYSGGWSPKPAGWWGWISERYSVPSLSVRKCWWLYSPE